MIELEEVVHEIEVPSNTGIDGFLHTIKILLRLSRLQELRIDSRGKITYRRFVDNEEEERRSVSVDFTTLEPHWIIRNSKVEEVQVYAGANAAVVIGGLLDLVATNQLKPLAFISGAATALWDWYKSTTNVRLRNRDVLHGFTFFTDRAIPDTALILAAGYGKDAVLADTRVSYKIEIPQYKHPSTDVEILL